MSISREQVLTYQPSYEPPQLGTHAEYSNPFSSNHSDNPAIVESTLLIAQQTYASTHSQPVHYNPFLYGLPEGYQTSGITIDSPSSAYSIKELEDQRNRAVQVWSTRVKLCCCFQAAFAFTMFWNPYWYLNFMGFIMAGIGIYGATHKKNEYIFAHLVLILVSYIKDAVVLGLSCKNDAHSKIGIALIIVLVFNALFIGPISAYCTYYLYYSLQATLTFKR
eukprot:TRINITY_DN14109_c0_g1_i1.p1 TRINITY_DN14109_c0_g1~~TRINITY_DN14109_c0_g1_i1.p1  ORF type:complete len:221 (-),score=4.32 TRINITY_DN14109_c0_g1_i1:260-922(-)